jgi:acetyl-CoA C-acetyltransferase
MGNTAELLAEKYSISRLEQDLFAIESHRKALEAVRLGRFKNETLPIHVTDKKREFTVIEEDIPRPDVSLEALERLPAIFKKEGTVTAGNSCALCDSAAALVLMAEDKAKQNGLKPIGSIVSYGAAGVDPKYMGIGPVQAIPIALRLAGLELHQIDLIELNEAFAVQYLAVEKELQLDREKVNVHGGAIALGHPVGATGAKIMTTLLHALQSHQKKTGLVSACVGGGQGLAIIVENAN